MPDDNKFEALRQAAYTIPVTCGLCIHGDFPSGFAMWGTCGDTKYRHLKHTGPDRDVSIVRCGTCPKAVLDINLISQFGTHQDFIKKG